MNLAQTQQLLDLMVRLRDPVSGCAWDIKQNFASLAPYAIEEAYELADAIERNDIEDMRSELGDLLLQVVFHAQMASEQDLFNFEAIAAGISEKLIRRHPHVFAEVTYNDDTERQAAWEAAKAQERQAKQPDPSTSSILDGIAGNLPALVHAEKIQDRAAQHGFDWPTIEPVFDKVLEELDEIKEAYHSGDQKHIEEEVGDLLFVAVNLARHLNVNPEAALKASTKKFTNRFQYIEQQVKQHQRTLIECELIELDLLWDEAKRILKK